MNDFYNIIEDNEHFLVVYKKPNTNFHSENNHLGLFEIIKQTQMLTELYPVHRLDKVTSGVLLLAKTAVVNQELTRQFRERTIEKYYLAISAKKPKKKQGLIKGDMEPSRRGAWKLLPTQMNPAITQFFSTSLAGGKRLFIIKPRTGKTHQIRVALKSIGAPIQGDVLYADTLTNIDIDRVYLHAFSIAFSVQGKSYRFSHFPLEGNAFLSEEFTVAAQEFRSPWSLAWPKI